MNTHFQQDFDPKTHKITENYMFTSKLHRNYLERELNKTGVYRSQHQILMFIANNPNVSQKDIAKLHHVSTATIAVSLKKLEKGGYIVRSMDKEDNRFNKICITGRGMDIVNNSINVFKRIEKNMFDGFSEEELNQFNGYFERLCKNLDRLLIEN